MTNNQTQQGNVIFFILIAVALFAALNYALMRGDGGVHNIDNERHIILSTEVIQYGAELSQAVKIVLNNNLSESDLSFAHANASSNYGDAGALPTNTQIFSVSGGQAEYRLPSSDISSAATWEFYGESAMPQVGSLNADLIAVLPDVTKPFCDVFNGQQGLDISGTYPEDTATCFKAADADRFVGSFNGTPNTLDTSTFSLMPTQSACVQCGTDYHIYMVIYAR